VGFDCNEDKRQMATINEITVCTKWINDAEGNRPDLGDFITMIAGEAWEDITGQSATKLPTTPSLYIIRARLFDANFNIVKNSNRFFILARKTWDTTDPDILTFNNLDEVPTTQQLQAFGDAILARFPDANVDKLKESGQAIIKAGLTREQIINKLITRWRKFEKALYKPFCNTDLY